MLTVVTTDLGRITGLYIAWRLRHQTKAEFLSSNRTQKGQLSIDRCHRPPLQVSC